MANDSDIRKNGSGYFDPTAYKAMKSIDKANKTKNVSGDAERFRRLLEVIINICELSGFHLEGHIVVKDKGTGKIWR